MVLKQLRISRKLTQEQLAEISGLNVRTIQRIESGQNASLESKKCLAAALEVNIDVFDQASIKLDKRSDHWKALPLFLKVWFIFHFLQLQPKRISATRAKALSHVWGFVFCCLGLVSEPALVGGLIMLANGHLFDFLRWQGDKYELWVEPKDTQLDAV